jgi:DNA-binding CsgD family transcriptional regulator
MQLAIGLLPKRLSTILTARKWIVAFAGMCAIGTVLLGWKVLPVDADGLSAICILAGLLTGVGSGYLLVLWGCTYSAMSRSSVVSNTSIAFTIAFILYYILVTYSFYPVSAVLTVLLPVIEGMLLAMALRSGLPVAGTAEREARIKKRMFILRIGIFAAILGLAMGALREIAITSLPVETADSEQVIILFGFIVLTLVIIHLILLSERPSQEKFSLRIPILFAGVTVALLFITRNESSLVYRIVELVGYFTFEISIWSAFVWMVHQSRIFPLKVFGLGLAFLSIGHLLGSISNKFILLSSEPLSLNQIVNPIVLMFVLLLATYLMSKEKNIQEIIEPQRSDSAEDARGGRIEAVARRYRLTDREREILGYIAKGRDTAYISKRLYISENTTKTHMKRIFKKTAVHSRQALMDIVDEADDECRD